MDINYLSVVMKEPAPVNNLQKHSVYIMETDRTRLYKANCFTATLPYVVIVVARSFDYRMYGYD